MKRSPIRQTPAVDRSGEPGYGAWHERAFGRCQVCGKPGLLVRHHVMLEQHVRRHGGDPWDLRNAILLGDGRRCRCHADHHAACARIAVRLVPDAAIAFCSELLGPGAGAYLSRFYAP